MTWLQGQLPVLPVVLPLITAALLLAGGDGLDSPEVADRRAVMRTRVLSLSSIAVLLGISAALAVDAAGGDWRVYRLGEWQAPFGIVLTIDRLSAAMVLLTQAVALPVAAYACGGWDLRGRHFHALLHFQLMGLNGAFLTGDLFNLFVFFEVLLIASYVLLVHGQGRQRFRVGVPYVALNLAASGLFLIGVALLYAVTGTLNMADLAMRVGRFTGTEALLLQVGGLLLLVVFGFKAALVPLHLWLPATYAAASPPVAALFALMTKVGVYAILRVHGVVFGEGAGVSAWLAADWLLPLALGGSLLAALGALGANSLSRMIGWLTIASVGTILVAVSLYTPGAWSAAIYYTLHSTLVMAALFLVADLIAQERGRRGDRLAMAAPVAQPALLGSLLVLVAASVVGLPPLPGFIGKLMILQAATGPSAPWVWSAVLLVGFVSLLSLARAGSLVFWKVAAAPPSAQRARSGLVAATALVVLAMLGLTIAAAPLKRYTDAAAAQLADREGLARAVLGPDAGAGAVRPYRAGEDR
ncbi:monovalent cation/H+ antiporter subunit D [Ramlibacter sp. AW1]|uniref:Monovalent cation/H+ antiporter subunit D n=1 Tax=Ramlibacter aurantiacus TaxID=2801330 RepID=A0A937D293_9BURK|nr:monovalent cation/H+ antiporter subunit D [Ramlibacter aurantiacus]MBL0419525.1 monovalent cation/H+ antiporter subunit D [Ramlibacter aurantiacus]